MSGPECYDDVVVSEGREHRNGRGLFHERDGIRISRETIEVSAEEAREPFQSIQRADRMERLRVERERDWSGKATSTAASRLLSGLRVWCRVGAEKELRIAGCSRQEERLAIRFSFEYRETVVMRLDSAPEDRVAILEEVVCRDGRGDSGPSLFNESNCLFGRDMLEHDFELRIAIDDPEERFFEEALLAIENIDFPVCVSEELAVDREYETAFCHSFEDWTELLDICHAMRRIGRCVGWIELGGEDAFRGGCHSDRGWRGIVGQVDRHEWLESRALPGSLAQCLKDAVSVVDGLLYRCDWMSQIRHNECSSEDVGGMREDEEHGVSITEVEMEVIGTSESKFHE